MARAFLLVAAALVTGITGCTPEVPSWHYVGAFDEPPFLPPWAPPPEDWLQPLRFARTRNGFVHLEGCAANGQQSSPLFVLPPRHRPARSHFFTVYARQDDQTQINVVQIDADGRVLAHWGGTSVVCFTGVVFGLGQ